MSIRDVVERATDALMAIPGVVGVGIGESAGRPVILVMVDELSPALEEALPQRLGGFDVQVNIVGEIRPFDSA
jgi:hypothetical protein